MTDDKAQVVRRAFAAWFACPAVAEMCNIQIPVPEADWHYEATLEGPDSLQIVISGAVVRDSDKTVWLHLGAYEARQMAALLNGFADTAKASHIQKGGA